MTCNVQLLTKSLVVAAALAAGVSGLAYAADAVSGPWHGFQSLGVDLVATGDALSETALAHARKRSVDHLQKLPVVVALMEQEFFSVRTRSFVRDILCRVFVHRAPILLDARNHAAQFLLPRFQLFAKVLQLLLVHG